MTFTFTSTKANKKALSILICIIIGTRFGNTDKKMTIYLLYKHLEHEKNCSAFFEGKKNLRKL